MNKKLVITVFGASGDLFKLKVLPALFELFKGGVLGSDFAIVGFSRTDYSKEEFHSIIRETLDGGDGSDEFIENIFYCKGDYSNLSHLEKFIGDTIGRDLAIRHIFYFSVPPTVYKTLIGQVGENFQGFDSRNLQLVFEKPFGADKAGAEELFHFVNLYFKEDQVYLLDHYLGKFGVQSLLGFRNSNLFLGGMMNPELISNIQISVLEEVGVEDRLGYFDEIGILRDMVQSHILQMLSFICMDIPLDKSIRSLAREKNNILESIKFIAEKESIVFGQYDGYAKSNSDTETFIALKLFLDKQNWYKTPIFIRTGKKLKAKETYVAIEFKKFPFQKKSEPRGRLIFYIYPEVRIEFQMYNVFNKSFGQSVKIGSNLDCNHSDFCMSEHAVLLKEILEYNAYNFLTFPEVISSWKLVDDILKYRSDSQNNITLYKYDSKCVGPEEADKLTGKYDFQWFNTN